MFSKPLVSATLKPMMLSILAEGEAYGYQIISRIQKISGGQMKWTTGTLYPLLHRLEKGGLVESYWLEVPNAPRRKYYRLTPAGHKALVHEKQQWLEVQQMMAGLWGLKLRWEADTP